MLAKLLIGLVKLYQWTLSPYFGQQCRFSPTCSQYAIEALQKHGAMLGLAYAVRRIGKCHPWHPGGHDAVP